MRPRTPETETELEPSLAKRPGKSSPIVRIYRHTSIAMPGMPRHRCEGHLEANFALWSDFSKQFRFLNSRVDSVTGWNGRRRYTADYFGVNKRGEGFFIEIKADEALEDTKFTTKFTLLQRFFAANGRRLILVTRDQMPSRAHLRNLRRFYIYKTGLEPLQEEVNALLEMLAVGESASMHQLAMQLAEKTYTTHAVWFGLAHGHLQTDMERDITFSSEITRIK
ncbi:hypothetical protein [Spongiibacter marinus]|uniref:hypothetical protein n=1 Tax=Spongiibacter marinus TaxID=354246 RepID=UPI0012B5930A|nr:hypothetical protein [Spongiibacter marinus]